MRGVPNIHGMQWQSGYEQGKSGQSPISDSRPYMHGWTEGLSVHRTLKARRERIAKRLSTLPPIPPLGS